MMSMKKQLNNAYSGSIYNKTKNMPEEISNQIILIIINHIINRTHVIQKYAIRIVS